MTNRTRLLVGCLVVAAGGAINSANSSEPRPHGPRFAVGHDPTPKGKRWTRVGAMSDEFSGKRIDLDKWQVDPQANGWGWIGRPPGLFRAENVKLSDGKMCVTVGVLPAPRTINRQKFLYQGAIIRSLRPGRVGWYYETRMKANATAMSSTFWLKTKSGPKRQELDIQECVGHTTDQTPKWAKAWDQVFHSNLIRTEVGVEGKTQFQRGVATPTKNHERFYVYGAWWKSPDEVLFFLDGEHQYTLKPDVKWNLPAHLQIAIETYDWNPVPTGGGLVATGTLEQRTTQYDWIRTWRLR